MSGTPFTYTVNSDVNGDGIISNDPIYIPRNGADASEVRIGTGSGSAFAVNAAAGADFESFIAAPGLPLVAARPDHGAQLLPLAVAEPHGPVHPSVAAAHRRAECHAPARHLQRGQLREPRLGTRQAARSPRRTSRSRTSSRCATGRRRRSRTRRPTATSSTTGCGAATCSARRRTARPTSTSCSFRCASRSERGARGRAPSGARRAGVIRGASTVEAPRFVGGGLGGPAPPVRAVWLLIPPQEDRL